MPHRKVLAARENWGLYFDILPVHKQGPGLNHTVRDPVLLFIPVIVLFLLPAFPSLEE